MITELISFVVKVAIPVHMTLLAIKNKDDEKISNALKYFFFFSLLLAFESLLGYLISR